MSCAYVEPFTSN